MISRAEAAADITGEGVGDNHLFAETDAEQQGAVHNIVPVPQLPAQLIELRHHVFVMQNRSGN
ncbi:hypothetical protein D3C73_1441380 [compost metagenome]